jgi:hypothetical protein
MENQIEKPLIPNEKYARFATFINNSRERCFNDRLMLLLVLEIKLKSFELNEELILPRYQNKSFEYKGEKYESSAMIKDVLPQKALSELKELVCEGGERDFETLAECKEWIHHTTGIARGSISIVETDWNFK